MENGAKGASVSVSGKLRAQRAKTMKFTDGYMISSGHPVKEYVDSACASCARGVRAPRPSRSTWFSPLTLRFVLSVRLADCHVKLRQGVLGIKVKIMLPHDPSGRCGPSMPLPDVVTVIEAKEESLVPAAGTTNMPPVPV
jgi:small subunit ribosomal protein S3e